MTGALPSTTLKSVSQDRIRSLNKSHEYRDLSSDKNVPVNKGTTGLKYKEMINSKKQTILGQIENIEKQLAEQGDFVYPKEDKQKSKSKNKNYL